MPKRHALLVAYLLFSGQELRDELATMYIRVVGRWFNKADKRHWQHFQSNGRAINRKLHDFMRLRQGPASGAGTDAGSRRCGGGDHWLGATG